MPRPKSSLRYAQVKAAIDTFWQENHYPPTIRELMEMTGVTSTSVMTYYIKHLPEIRIAKRGRVIPVWVDAMLTPQQEARTEASNNITLAGSTSYDWKVNNA